MNVVGEGRDKTCRKAASAQPMSKHDSNDVTDESDV